MNEINNCGPILALRGLALVLGGLYGEKDLKTKHLSKQRANLCIPVLISIVEKDQQGASSLFSLADINGIRPEVPFEKWYLSGRFGGVPGIEKLNFELNFQHEAE